MVVNNVVVITSRFASIVDIAVVISAVAGQLRLCTIDIVTKSACDDDTASGPN